MGESDSLPVETLGGKMHVPWAENASSTPHGQRVFFAEFLHKTSLFNKCVNACPLTYTNANAPHKRDVHPPV